jgi:FAD-linked oxidoreductase
MKIHFKNWSESVVFNPTAILYPSSEEEIVAIVKLANQKKQKIRVVGSGHSFTPLVETNSVLISLDNLKGAIKMDENLLEAEVFSGTKLHELGPLLLEKNMALENMGDIDIQSIAGAFSSSTHGTGLNFGILSNQVLAITLVNGNGDIVRLEKDKNGEEFKAAQVSLGMLGIITRIKLKLLPAYKLNYVSKKATFEHTLENFEKYNNENRNFEFYWFPHTETCQLKFVNPTQQKPSNEMLYNFNVLVMENYVFKLLSEIARVFSVPKFISKLSAAGVSTVNYTNWSFKVFATKRIVKFQEMEYNVPREHFKTILTEIKELISSKNIKVHFPIECRIAKADDILISPAYGRESAYIAVHMYKGMEYKEYFLEVQKIVEKYNGRPHWGKMHFSKREYFKLNYPKWESFIEIRKKYDPENIFLNTHLNELFQ